MEMALQGKSNFRATFSGPVLDVGLNF